MKKKETTANKITARESKRQEIVHSENATIERLSSKSGTKDKSVCVRFNSEAYARFQKICAARGMTASGCLNIMLMDFVREYKDVLEE
ncbi:MAG: hypothetical protein NC123_16320 [Butyrivibrio sp.]|nr:hypothetical protein [Butyrivibrio sp.]